MKTWMPIIAFLVNALAGVLFLIAEKYALAVVFFSLAVVFFAAGRRATGSSGSPSAKENRPE